MGSSTKNQKVRSDNRRMTGNVNIYICSEAAEKNEKNAEENVTQTYTPTSESSTSLISEKSRQKVGPVDEHLASPNRVRKKLAVNPPEKQINNTVNKDARKDINSAVKKDAAKDSNSIDEQLISTTEFNKFTSYESKSNPTAEENILKNTKESFEHKVNDNTSTRYDRSKMVSCRCPQFDESDLWLQKALKRQNRDSTGTAPSHSVKKADQNDQRSADAPKISGKSEGLDKKCTCDRNEKLDSKGNGACEQLCTCCCIDVHKKENINGSKSKKIDKKQTREFKKEMSKSSHDKKEFSLEKKDKKTTENQAELKVTNSKDKSKDTKENLKTKKSNSSEKVKSTDKVIKVEKSNDSKKSSKERLPPVESEPNKKSKKDLENVKKAEKKSKLSVKEKANKENFSPKEKPQEVQSQSKEKKKIKKEKKSTKTKNKLALKENSENKSSEPRKSDDAEAQKSAKTKKKKEKKAKEALTDSNESSHRKAINDQKEDSFFSKLMNMMKSNKKVSSKDVKKRGCSPDCTGLTKATETSTKNKSNREKSGQKSKSSGTIISDGSHNIQNEFHDFKSASDTQVNDTVDLNLGAKTGNDEKPVPLMLDKTDDTADKTFDHSKAEDKSEEFRYYVDCVDRYPEITKINVVVDNDEPYSRLLEKNCSCYDCLREYKAACDQFSFSNSHPYEAYFEKSIESCCACKPQKPVTNFKEDRRRCFNDLQDCSLVMTNKLRRGTGSAHCCWCSCRDNSA